MMKNMGNGMESKRGLIWGCEISMDGDEKGG